MRKLLRWIAYKLGITTSYQVTAIYPQPGGGFCVTSTVLGFRPWLHFDNFGTVRDFMKTQISNPNVEPNIVSITKLGL